MKLDILVLASHPDDAELCCGGTIASHIRKGYKVGIVDFTAGELGTRGSASERIKEAEKASGILGLSARENLGLSDGFFSQTKEECLAVITAIRKFRPEIILANAPQDRHPDHGRGASLASRANFLSGLQKIDTWLGDTRQEVWRARQLFHYIQDRYLVPDFITDITNVWEVKLQAINAYSSQFYNPARDEPMTYISTPDFLGFIESRAAEMGHAIGVRYGEGFIKERQMGIADIMSIL
jgi:bacillithiol biosynthesis deacetylase BshB1